MGLGDPPMSHLVAVLGGPGSEGWDVGAVRAVQQDQVGFCRGGGAETSLLGTAGSPCQPPARAHRGLCPNPAA